MTEEKIAATGGKSKILVAEDDKFLSRVIGDKLKRNGFEVILALNGTEAVEKTISELPHLVLLDLVMPEKDGFEVLQEIKGNPKLKDIPVVIMSNLGQDADIKKCKQLGAVDYMIKSDHGINEIVDKAKEVLNNS